MVEKSNVPIHKWITFYFGEDGPFCRCQNRIGKVQCNGNKDPCPECKDKNDFVTWNSNTCSFCKTPTQNLCLTGDNNVVKQILSICNTVPDLKGIMFDDEKGDPTNIIKAMESVKTEWDKNTGKSLKLGWTGGLSAANLIRPRNIDGKYTWDVCLGQAYTNTTANYYSGSCNTANNWWDSVAIALGNSDSNKGVPMVCGAGNCIGDMDGSNHKCYDERLSADKIGTLIKNRPNNYKWKNFGIWYGTYVENKGFFGCINKNCPIDKGCCTDWFEPKIG